MKDDEVNLMDEIETAIGSLEAADTGAEDYFSIWKAYSHTELAVLIAKLQLKEDLLLNETERRSVKTNKQPAELLREAQRLIERNDLGSALDSLRVARDLLMDSLKSVKRKSKKNVDKGKVSQNEI
jgi:hypothetical protein